MKRRMVEILADSAVVTGVPVSDIRTLSTVRPIVVARHHVMWLQHAEGHSFSAIGRFWGMDHTTVMNACKRHEERIRAGQPQPDPSPDNQNPRPEA